MATIISTTPIRRYRFLKKMNKSLSPGYIIVNMNEKGIIAAAQQGNERAFTLLVKRYDRRIYRTAYNLCRDTGDAADITQEVFIRTWKHLSRFDTDRPLYPWLYQITKNLYLNRLRKGQSDPVGVNTDNLPARGTESDLSGSPETDLLKRETEQQIWAALREMPEKQREIILLKHFDGCSYTEIAEILEIPKGTVMSRLYNARKNLKKLLEVRHAM